MEVQSRGGIELSSDPNVAKQSIDHTGHPTKSWTTDINLAEIRQSRDNQDQQQKMQRTLPSFDHASQVAQPKHVENDMHGAGVKEHGSEQTPKLAMSNFRQSLVPNQVVVDSGDVEVRNRFPSVAESCPGEYHHARHNHGESQWSDPVRSQWPE